MVITVTANSSPTVAAGSSHHPSSTTITALLNTATPSTHHPLLLPNRLPIKYISKVIRKKNRRFQDLHHCIYLPHPSMPQEKKTFRLMFLPLL
jgi:hypothetical protein